MLKKDYTAKLLNLEDVIITNVENISEEVHVYLELPRVKHRCPACGALTDRVHDYGMQIIKDVPLGRTTLLHLRKRRYRCDCDKRFFEKNTLRIKKEVEAYVQQINDAADGNAVQETVLNMLEVSAQEEQVEWIERFENYLEQINETRKLDVAKTLMDNT